MSKRKSTTETKSVRNSDDTTSADTIGTIDVLLEFSNMCNQEGTAIKPKILLSTLSGEVYQGTEEQETPLSEHEQSMKEEEAEDVPKVRAYLEYPDIPASLHKIQIRGFPLDLPLLKVCERCASAVPNLSVFKFEHCGLTAELVEHIAVIFSVNNQVKELSLDWNIVPEENYYLLLCKDSKLSRLSLRHCSITDKGAAFLAKELERGAKEKEHLLALNLTNNKITCTGAKCFAKALHTNRMLASLSLAGNRIGDEGANALAEALHRFPLEGEEIVIYRKMRIERLLKEKEELEKLNLSEGKKSHSTAPGKKGKEEKRVRTTDSKKRDGEKSSKGKGIKTPQKILTPTASRKDLFDPNSFLATGQLVLSSLPDILPQDHPFATDVVAENKQLICSGNVRLAHLNLAYNKISDDAVSAFLDVLQYQEMQTLSPNKGLVHLSLQGNAISPNSDTFLKLKDMLETKQTKGVDLPTASS